MKIPDFGSKSVRKWHLKKHIRIYVTIYVRKVCNKYQLSTNICRIGLRKQ